MTRTSFSTRAIHAGAEPDPTTGAILTPIYQSTTYVQPAVGQDKGFTYSRCANPTVAALEKRLTALEGGVGTSCFATGMAATTALARNAACIAWPKHHWNYARSNLM